MEKIADLTGPAKEELPPLWEINHRIALIDEKKRLCHRVAKCPDALREQFNEKLKRYTTAGWWEAKSVPQASPMLVILKPNGKDIRTVVDCREHNANVVWDETPLPDQDMIRHAMAKCCYRSKIDLSDAYEQIRVEPSDVINTAFSTYVGTYVSHVMQQGDCNAPSTFHRFICLVFRDRLYLGVYPFIDDVHGGTDTIEEHEELLGWIFEKIREHKLRVNPKKVELYAEDLMIIRKNNFSKLDIIRRGAKLLL